MVSMLCPESNWRKKTKKILFPTYTGNRGIATLKIRGKKISTKNTNSTKFKKEIENVEFFKPCKKTQPLAMSG
jgi:hypothetical protein